jgi:hypothetical protein
VGFLKDRRADTAGAHAMRAREEGHEVYVHRFKLPSMTGIGYGGSPVSGAAEVIESIEQSGWRLEHISHAEVADHGSLLLMFRPAGQPKD